MDTTNNNPVYIPFPTSSELDAIKEQRNIPELTRAIIDAVTDASSWDMIYGRESLLPRRGNLALCTGIEIGMRVVYARQPEREEIAAAKTAGWQECLERVRASLRDYPNAVGDIEIMKEVERILERARAQGWFKGVNAGDV